MKGRFAEAVELNDSLLKLPTIQSDSNVYFKALSNKAKLAEINKDYHKAIDAAHQSVTYITNETSHLIGSQYAYISRYFGKLDQIDSMLHYFEKAKRWNDINNPYRNWTLYEQTAQKYIDMRLPEKAEDYLLKSYAITNEQKKRMDHGLILYRLSNFYEKEARYAEAVKYRMQYDKLTDKNSFDSDNIHNFISNESLLKNVPALLELKKSSEQIQYWNAVHFANANLAKLRIKKGQFQQAIGLLLKNEQLPYHNSTIKAELENTNLLIECFKELRDFEKAFQYQAQLTNLQDSIFNLESKKSLIAYQEELEAEKKQNQIDLLSLENAIKDQTIKEKQIFQNTLLILILGLLTLIGLVWFFLNQRNKLLDQLRTKNEIISKNLEEKDILLREIHHRVKNNLQVISSLLNLQSHYIEDEAALEAINEGRNRVSSMALIHQNLYQHDHLTSIFLPDYMEDLIENLFDSYDISKSQIEYDIDISPIRLDIETMIPLGLIVNELVSNALKHAFPSKDNGYISMELKVEAEALVLKISDNGKGVTEDEFNNSKSFGNKMIKAFQKKLGATFMISNDNGTLIQMKINNFKQIA